MVFNGTPDTNHPAVGRIITADAAVTGTLISDRHVLTAAHVASAEGVFVLGADSSQPEAEVHIEKVTLHPAYSEAGRDNDIAVLTLAQAVPPGIAPATFGEPGALAVGVTVTIVGYGNTSSGGGTDNSLRRSGRLALDEIAPLFLVANQPVAGPAEGDSGAPIFVENSNGARVVGIAVAGANDVAVFARLLPAEQFILEILGVSIPAMAVDQLVVPFVGRLTLGSADPEWTLHQGSGPRICDRVVSYTEADRMPPGFTEPPPGPPLAVTASLAGLHVLDGQDARLEVSVRNVHAEGMEIVFSTDGEAHVESATAEWIAFFHIALSDGPPP